MFICYEITSSETRKKYIGITGRGTDARIAQHFKRRLGKGSAKQYQPGVWRQI